MICWVSGCREKPKGAHDSPQQVTCTAHWFMIPPALRDTLTLLWNNGRPRDGWPEAVANAVAQINAKESR